MSLNHIILGNKAPLDTEMDDVKVDGNLTVLGTINGQPYPPAINTYPRTITYMAEYPDPYNYDGVQIVTGATVTEFSDKWGCYERYKLPSGKQFVRLHFKCLLGVDDTISPGAFTRIQFSLPFYNIDADITRNVNTQCFGTFTWYNVNQPPQKGAVFVIQDANTLYAETYIPTSAVYGPFHVYLTVSYFSSFDYDEPLVPVVPP